MQRLTDLNVHFPTQCQHDRCNLLCYTHAFLEVNINFSYWLWELCKMNTICTLALCNAYEVHIELVSIERRERSK